MINILLNREDFKHLVFQRDGNKCVVCGKPAVDAHHIIDRSLWSDGGYYLDNGVSLCEEHHIEAENTTLGTQELRELAKIKNIIYPNYLSLTEFVKDYDKWGNPILKNAKRLKGYDFNKENVQKMLKHGNVLNLFEKDYESNKPDKYGRTYHFPFSPGTTNDDRISTNYNNLCKNRIIMTEKLDGENNLILSDFGIFTRSRTDVTHNPWSVKMWELYYRIKDDIKGLEIYGESLYAEHSIIYSGLEEYFYIFGIKDTETDMWLSWEDVEFYSQLLNIPTVPVLFKSDDNFNCSSAFLKEIILDLMKVPSKLSNDKFWITPKEGVVCRLANSFPNDMFYNSILKYVRKNHVQTDSHWNKNWKRALLQQDLNFLSDDDIKKRYDFLI